MSYRLIDANAIASQRPEVNDMPCVYADLPSGLDGGHYDMRESDESQRENAKLREMCEKLYGYYVSGTLTPCDFCDRYDCEGNVPTTCKADEYDPDGMVVEEIERRMRELGLEAGE